MDTIERAIKRGTGELEGVRYESVNYEGYAPSGVAVIVETLTDNRNRTGADVRNLFSRNGGSMAEPGAVSWQFERKGVVVVPDGDEDKVMEVATEAGAEDLTEDGGNFVVTCAPNDLNAVRQAFDGAGLSIESAELSLEPTTTVPVPTRATRRRSSGSSRPSTTTTTSRRVHANFDICRRGPGRLRRLTPRVSVHPRRTGRANVERVFVLGDRPRPVALRVRPGRPESGEAA
jgi:hypothetical protein